MLELQSLANPYGPSALTSSNTYDGWEASSARGCACSRGWTGADCSVRHCPHGDSPYSLNQQRTAIRVLTRIHGVQLPKLRFYFNGAVTHAIDLATLTNANCLARFTADGTSGAMGIDVTESSCRVATSGSASAVDASALDTGLIEVALALSFSSAAIAPVTNIFTHNGIPAASSYGCYADPDDAASSQVECTVTALDVKTLTLTSNPFTSAAATLPAGVSYQLALTDASGFPARIVVTRTTDSSPPVTVTYDEQIILTSATSVGLASDGIFLYFNAVWGHTHNALWTISVDTDPLTLVETIVIGEPGYREFAVCGGAGTCSGVSGVCTCANGTSGPACNTVTAIALSTPGQPILDVVALAGDFAGSVLRVTSQRALGSAEFDYITVSGGLGVDPFFRLRGDGLLSGASAAFSDGVNIDGGVVAQLSSGAAPAALGSAALSVYYGSTSVVPVGGVATILSDFPLDSSYSAATTALAVSLRSSATAIAGESGSYEEAFAVGGDGSSRANFGLQVDRRGIDVVGPVGVTVEAGGLDVGDGGFHLGGGGYNVTGNSTHFGNIHVYGTITLQNGTLNILGPKSPTGVVINDRLIVINEAEFRGYTTAETGLEVVTGGITLSAGGLDVVDGGIVVGVGGLSVYAGGGYFTYGGLSTMGINGLVATNNDDPTLATSRVVLSGSQTVVSSFYSAVNVGWSGDLIYGEAAAPGSSSSDFNLLRLATRAGPLEDAASLRINSYGNIVSSSNLLITTESSTLSITGHVSLAPGASSAPPGSPGGDYGGNAYVVGGKSSTANGGDARLMGGEGMLAAGHAYVAGGYSSVGIGGHVFLTPGAGVGGAGDVRMQDASGTDRLTVTGNGDIVFTPASGTITSIASAAAPIITSATYLSMVGSVAAVVTGKTFTDGSQGGQVSIIGGSASSSANAGSVVIAPGISDTGNSGNVHIRSANNVRTLDRLVVTELATQVLADDDVALGITYGASAALSRVDLPGSLSVGGSVSFAGPTVLVTNTLSVGVDMVVQGGVSVAGATSIGGALTGSAAAHFLGPLTVGGGGGVTVAAGDVIIQNGGLFAYTTTELYSTVAVQGSMSIGGITSLTAGVTVLGDADVSGFLSVAGMTSLGNVDVAGNSVVQGALAVAGGLAVTGLVQLSNSALISGVLEIADGGSLSLNMNARLEGTDAVLSLHGASEVWIGGAASIGASATVYGVTNAKGGLIVASGGTFISDSPTELRSGLAVTGGILTASSDISSGGAGSFGGTFVAEGITSLKMGAIVAGGSLSVASTDIYNDPSGIVGHPLVLRGAGAFDAGSDGATVSLYGGAALDGNGGNVIISPGRKGGDNYDGIVRIENADNVAMLISNGDNLILSGTVAGSVSVMSPIYMAGALSVAGAASLLGPTTYVDGLLFAKGDAVFEGATGASSFLQSGTSGAISYEGLLAGSGRLSNDMLTTCGPNDWSLGGSCYQLFSEEPNKLSTFVELFWNFDTVPHIVSYGDSPVMEITISPGSTFPVYAFPGIRRRRRLADLVK